MKNTIHIVEKHMAIVVNKQSTTVHNSGRLTTLVINCRKEVTSTASELTNK